MASTATTTTAIEKPPASSQQQKKIEFSVNGNNKKSVHAGITGTKQHDTVKAVEKFEKVCIYVGSVSKDTTKDQLVTMINNEIETQVINCVSLKTKRNYDSYRVTIRKSDLEKALVEDKWPNGVRVREYVFEQKDTRRNDDNRTVRRNFGPRGRSSSRAPSRRREYSTGRDNGGYGERREGFHRENRYDRYESDYYDERRNRGRSRSRVYRR